LWNTQSNAQSFARSFWCSEYTIIRMLRPPGPKPHFLVGNILLAAPDQLGTFSRWAAEYGDIFYYRAAWLHVYFVNRPDLIEYVLVHNPQNFLKDRVIQNSTWLLGKGLLRAEGDYWKRQRRTIQPAFSRDRIASYARHLTGPAREMLAQWKSGTVFDIHEQMMTLTLRVVVPALFETQSVETERISRCQVLHRPGDIRSRSVGHAGLPEPAQVRVLSLRRRSQAMHWRLVCDDRGRAGPGHIGAEISLRRDRQFSCAACPEPHLTPPASYTHAAGGQVLRPAWRMNRRFLAYNCCAFLELRFHQTSQVSI
jgi:cytochrome P450